MPECDATPNMQSTTFKHVLIDRLLRLHPELLWIDLQLLLNSLLRMWLGRRSSSVLLRCLRRRRRDRSRDFHQGN
jgi:hypothetical protein